MSNDQFLFCNRDGDAENREMPMEPKQPKQKPEKINAWTKTTTNIPTIVTEDHSDDITKGSSNSSFVYDSDPDEESCEIVGHLSRQPSSSRSSCTSLPGSVFDADDETDP